MSVTVEGLGGLGVGVGVEKAVESGQGVGVGLASLPSAERNGNRKAGDRPTTETDVQVDLLGLDDGDVFDEEPGDPLALAGRAWPDLTTALGSRWPTRARAPCVLR